MSAQRLPVPGSDSGDWGDILNEFLSVSHNSDGTLQPGSVTQAGGLTSNTKLSGLADTSSASSAGNGQVLAFNSSNNTWVPSTVSSTAVSNATGAALGIVQLAGDLGGGTNGSATAPQVTSTHLASALPLNQGGTGQTSQAAALTALAGTQSAGKYLRSDGSNTTLSTIQAGDIPTLNQNTTGNAATANSATTASSVSHIPALSGDVTSNGTTNATVVGSLQGAVALSGTPSPGQTLVATSSTAAAWSANAGTVGPAGPTGLNWRDSYSNATTYATNDAVQYNGSSYIATTGNTGVNPGTPGSPNTGWSLLAEIGNAGPAGSGVAGTISPSNQGLLGWSFDPTLCGSNAGLFSGQIYATKITIPAGVTIGCSYYINTAGATLTANQNLIGLYDSNGNLQAESADCSGTCYTVTTTASSATVSGTGFVATMVGGQYTIAGVTGTFTVATVSNSTSLTMSSTIPTAVSSAALTPTANFSWLSTGIKYTTFVSSYTSSGGSYYLGFLGVGSTVPKLEAAVGSLPTSLVNVLQTGGAAGTGTFRSGQLGGLFSQTSLPGSITLSASIQLNAVYWIALY